MNLRLVPFFLLSIIQLVGIAFDWQEVRFYTKPLLMASLLFYFLRFKNFQKSFPKTLIIVALVMSLFGDTFLLFADKPEDGTNFFLAGLGSFLVAQLCYAFSFFKLKKNGTETRFNLRAYLLPTLFFLLILKTVWATLPDDLRIPVVIYALAIATMVSFAMQLKGNIPERAYLLISIGALLFMCSDSLIALNRFSDKLADVWKPSFWVMLTYLLGQAGIILGLGTIQKSEALN